MTEQDAALSSAKAALVTVAADADSRGRGFLVEAPLGYRFVITAAHCLPHLPPAHPASCTEERTYRSILGPLGGEATVSAECLFVDPIADLAVLCSPDNQTRFAEAIAYDNLMEAGGVLGIGTVTEPSQGWLFALDGQWETCTVDAGEWGGRRLSVRGAPTAAIAGGTSGSPIILEGRAVGVISCGEDLNPVLATDLPAWLLADLRKAEQERLTDAWSPGELSAALRPHHDS